jgi:hypothetical protein
MMADSELRAKYGANSFDTGQRMQSEGFERFKATADPSLRSG